MKVAVKIPRLYRRFKKNEVYDSSKGDRYLEIDTMEWGCYPMMDGLRPHKLDWFIRRKKLNRKKAGKVKSRPEMAGDYLG